MGKKRSANILYTIVFSLHCYVQKQFLVPERLWQLESSHFALIDHPLSNIFVVIDLNGEDFALIDEQRLIPASHAIAPHEHTSLSSSVVECPETNGLRLVVITTVSLTNAVLIDEPNADCVLPSVLH
jgi:hypothetical protein